MDDIEALCDRVMVVGNGRILVEGSVDNLRRRVRNERVLVMDYDSADEAVALDAEGEGVRLVERDASRVGIAFDPDRVPVATLIGALLAQGTPRDLFVEHPPIEQTVAELYAEHDVREQRARSSAHSGRLSAHVSEPCSSIARRRSRALRRNSSGARFGS